MRAIRCRAAVELMSRDADARLSATEKAALDAHLATCARCSREAALLAGSAERLRRRTPAPPGFTDRVLRGVARSRTPEARARVRVPVRTWLPVAAGLLFAAGLAFVGLHRRAAGPAEAPRVPVELELAAAGVRSVAVAGDFNDWDASQMKRGADGVWRIRLSLPPGRYQYVFVVDEKQWMADPRAPTVVDNGYDGTNSVLDVSL